MTVSCGECTELVTGERGRRLRIEREKQLAEVPRHLVPRSRCSNSSGTELDLDDPDPPEKAAEAGPANPREHGRLTPREVEVVELLAMGLTGPQIAERLVISPETVRTHVRNAMEKRGARTRAHLIAIAVRDGLLRSQRAAAGAKIPVLRYGRPVG